MNKRLALLTAASIGAGAMYLLDPDRGARRRGLLRDKAVRFTRVTRCSLGQLSRDLRNRATGVISEIRASTTTGDVADSVLVNRIKSQLGKYPVHHRSILIDANGGAVTLSGDVLQSEAGKIVAAVSSVRGVKDVINHLAIHETATGIPGVQGHPIGAEKQVI